MKQVKLVGILNITPDSFSDGGQYVHVEQAVAHAEQLFKDGASIVDLGAESTNPQSTTLSPDDEWVRLEPVLRALLPKYAHALSIDSYHPETIAHAADTFGPTFIANDVTGMNNPAMRSTVAAYNLHCIISHLPARFGTDIQAAHKDAAIDDEQVVLSELLHRRDQLIALGLTNDDIILDPGIGFGKTMELCEQLLRFAHLVPDNEVMIGYSKKRFLGEHRFDIESNLAAGRIAIAAGAHYLRVHDVAAHRSLIS